MAVLLLAEVNADELSRDTTAKAVTAASMLGDVTLLCVGSAAAVAAESAARIDGVSKVLVADDHSLGHRLAEPAAALIVSLARDYDYIVAPATTDAKNILPRVAALLDVMVIPDISGILGGNTFVRPVFAGNAFQTVKSSDSKKVISIRTSAFDAAGAGAPVPLESIGAIDVPRLSEWVEDSVVENDRPGLTSARVVVSGGRGVGSAEDFALIKTLADKLGAAVGASRAAVDSGYAPNDVGGFLKERDFGGKPRF